MILITGGAGFIGSHTAVALLNAGYEIGILDNLSNSKYESIRRIKQLTEKECPFFEIDLLDYLALDRIFCENKIDSVIHFAGFKAVGESVSKPLEYYHNNITGTLNLCRIMREHNVKKLVFSSSATVYGLAKVVPVTEDMPISATNPYGSTKLMIENILNDLFVSDNDWSIALLRYFNPIGAHKSGILGENPNGIPNNLMPRICNVVNGKMDKLTIWGTDYATHDGTGVRDYIHVLDLADGHIAALNKCNKDKGIFTYNLGTGIGYSVFDLINTFARVNNVNIPYDVCPRRPGDVASLYADCSKAEKEMSWKAKLGLEDMCADSYKFVKKNPKGYEDSK
ncbi:MAG: UDP-glucose 4-epimerase GalE [Clostridiales bacterium GWF2_38_85]|nr:MAG: UDP-glucose 4-epimerase GalE [Clostridiales bacterium GWF2_38_85]HBL83566.1 UDP-glucose 4-epimerase GalE [Clostridiales bacterium]